MEYWIDTVTSDIIPLTVKVLGINGAASPQRGTEWPWHSALPLVQSKVAAVKQIFISYGHADGEAFAGRLRRDLETTGYVVWWDESGIRLSQPWDAAIERAILDSSLLVAVLTPHATREDSVCRDEVAFALVLPRPVIPARVSPDAQFTLPLVRRNWVDFTRNYDEGLRRLREFLAGAEDVLLPPALPTVSGLTPLDFGPEIAQYGFGFVGRDWLRQRISHWLHDASDRVFVVVGEPGAGKSAIAAWLCQTRPVHVIGIHFCTTRNRRTLNPYELVTSLVAQFYSELQGYDSAVEPAYPQARRPNANDAFRELIVEPTRKMPAPDGPRLVVVDSLDEATSMEGETIVDLLAEHADTLPAWLRIVVTTRPVSSILIRLARFKTLDLSAERERNQEDVAAYVRQRLSQIESIASSDSELEATCVRLQTRAEGNFLYAHTVLEALTDPERRLGHQDIGAIPPELKGLYYSLFQKRFKDIKAYELKILPLLNCLVAAREPIPERLLVSAVNGEEPGVRCGLLDLAQFLRWREEGIRLFHSSLADWLTEAKYSLEYAISTQAGHQQLASACWKEYESDTKAMSPYATRHLPVHLVEARRWHDLRHLVFDSEMNLVTRWVEQGEGNTGLYCLDALIRHLEKPEHSPMQAAGLATQAARICSLRGEYQEARERLNYALARTSWWRGRRIRAIALHELGSLHLYDGDTVSAKRCYCQALRLCLWGMPIHHDEAAANLIGLATVAYARYEFEEVMRQATWGLRQARQAHDIRHIVAAARMIATVHKAAGRYDETDSYLQLAAKLSETEQVHLEKARLLMLRGWLEYDRALLEGWTPGQTDAAFREALCEAERVHDLYYTLEARLALGWCALVRGDLKEGAKWLEMAGSKLLKRQHGELLAEYEMELGALAHVQGDSAEALKWYQSVADLCREKDIRIWLYRALTGQGAIAWHAGQHEQGERVWADALCVASSMSATREELARRSIKLCQSASHIFPR
ncbi:MAG: TIR domain-containing protein [Candidatus Eisenbacteria bacterium]|nr:TIR domain-containing protein [Candidatus Eisenbacteria bacterium]